MGQIYRKINPAAILDIGAHHGYTVDKLLDYAPGAKVHAFEPTPQSAAILRQRMSKRFIDCPTKTVCKAYFWRSV